MKRLFISLMIGASLLSLPINASNPPLKNLASLSWKHRIILAKTDNDSDRLIQLFSQKNAGIMDRDIVWFVLYRQTIKTNYEGQTSSELVDRIQEKYLLRNHEVILIGKDGGVKERITKLDLERLFNDIDRMPMRQNEMQRK